MIKIKTWLLQGGMILLFCSLTFSGARGEVPANATPVPNDDSRLTLELQGVDILDVLKILSKKSGLNIVAGKNVQGTAPFTLLKPIIFTASFSKKGFGYAVRSLFEAIS